MSNLPRLAKQGFFRVYWGKKKTGVACVVFQILVWSFLWSEKFLVSHLLDVSQDSLEDLCGTPKLLDKDFQAEYAFMMYTVALLHKTPAGWSINGGRDSNALCREITTAARECDKVMGCLWHSFEFARGLQPRACAKLILASVLLRIRQITPGKISTILWPLRDVLENSTSYERSQEGHKKLFCGCSGN